MNASEAAPESPFDLPFSAATRRHQWLALGEREFDLLVIGGGITGVGIAHEAAGRGLEVAVVEAGDLGGGTSSRSSRLIHGGLRYLETMDFGLVFEALGERARLLQLAPHLVRPLPFLYPVYAGGEVGMLKLRAGMWLYDVLSMFRGVRRHRMLGRGDARRREPGLRAEGLRGAALYFDAQVDDARLTLAVARAAHQAGAVVVPRARVEALPRAERGARVRDQISGAQVEVRARVVLSAAGPWTDQVRRLADPDAPPRLRPTKGVHIQLPRDRIGNHGAVIFRSPVDGRVMFVLPWGDFTYVGTTDTDFTGDPDAAHRDADDVEYLLRSANGIFPEARLASSDVVSTWTGVRPLLAPAAEEGSLSAGQTSREHEIWREPSGLVCIAGGKLTTYRVMARDAVRFAAELLQTEHGVEAGEHFGALLPLPGAPEGEWKRLRAEIRERAAAMGIGAAAAEHLASAYGEDARLVLALAEADPALRAPVLAPHPNVWAEVPFAVRHEMALTLEDVLRRRMHLFYDDAQGALAVAPTVAARMAEEAGIGWTPEQVREQVELYGASVRATRAAPTLQAAS